jgi:hypothetical protein
LEGSRFTTKLHPQARKNMEACLHISSERSG